jgi:hypothetical protein
MDRWILALAFALCPIGRLDAQSDSGFAAWAKAGAVPIDVSVARSDARFGCRRRASDRSR